MKKLATITISFGLILGFASCKFATDYMDEGLFATANAIAPIEVENKSGVSETEHLDNGAVAAAPVATAPEAKEESAPATGAAEPEVSQEIVQNEVVEAEVLRLTKVRAAPMYNVGNLNAWSLINNNGISEWAGETRTRIAFNVENRNDISTIDFNIEQYANGVKTRNYVFKYGAKIGSEGASGWQNGGVPGMVYRALQMQKGDFKLVVTVHFTDGTSETSEREFSIK